MTGVRAWPAVGWTLVSGEGWTDPGLPFVTILFIILMDRISRHSHGVKGVRFGDFRIRSLLFADDAVLLAPLVTSSPPAELVRS